MLKRLLEQLLEWLGIGFGQPMFLWLIPLLVLLWVFSFRSLAGLGNFRRLVAIGLRTAVFLLIVLALAELQWRKSNDVVTVIYLLDQSESIPPPKREAMMHYVAEEVYLHRDRKRRDLAGVIVFGRNASVEIPPYDDQIPRLAKAESFLQRRDATNLEDAMKLAQASFPEDTAKRIVIVSDGNENLGNARSIAPLLADQGIGIDVVPVTLESRAEVRVDKVTMPQQVRRGQTVETRVVLDNTPTEGEPGMMVDGTLRVTRRFGGQEELISEEDVSLRPGKTVLGFKHKIDKPAMYTYRAVFTPRDRRNDTMSQNNEASAFTHVRGRGRVLLIEDADHKGDFDFFVDRMQAKNLEITVQSNDQLYSSLAELQGYDTVILANVPRASGEDARSITSFTDAQIDMLVRNTQQMGCGLIMLGGPSSFGAGGWTNTELEKAMPVDFQIRNTKVRAVGALVLMMHASEMAQGNYWQKVVGAEAIKALGPMDYAGLIHWDNLGGDAWMWGKPNGLVRISGQKNKMLASLNRMTPGDMPQFDPAMRMALAGFNRVNASVKHMIIISDGDPAPPTQTTMNQYIKSKIKISTVAVGTHGPAGSTPLQKLATATGGKYYVVTNPKALPRIYQREARKVSRPLIFEPPGGVQLQVTYRHEMHPDEFTPPPVKGFMLTTVKSNPLVEVSIVGDKPDAGGPNSTILASWTYGLGRSIAFTTDVGKQWAGSWTEWEDYDKFFSQMIIWSMRPVNDDGKFSVNTDIKDGKVRVVVTALDKNDEYINFLNVAASAITPDLEAIDFNLRQLSAGRYVGEFDASKAGSYFITVSPGAGRAPILAGIDVPYSAEYRERETNLALLEALAGYRPRGGEPGKLIAGELKIGNIKKLTEVDTFRHNLPRAISSQDMWPLVLVLTACLFFADVLVRRVTPSYEWIAPVVQWVSVHLFRRQEEPQEDVRLERLRNTKKEASERFDERRATTRFEPQIEQTEQPRDLDSVLTDVRSGSPPPAPRPPSGGQGGTGAPQTEEEDYTSRLLKAKKKAWKDPE